MPLDFENKYYNKNIKYIVGCDEAGRGCLLGPVFAAAVILPFDFKSDLINDSKKLTPKQRDEAYEIITKNAISWGVGIVSVEEIDKINILEASRKAMEIAISKLNHQFDLVLTDYMQLHIKNVEVISLVHGDSKAQCIAAASIIAKVSRDRFCLELDKKYPVYNIKNNKGYGTKDHLLALETYGPVKGLHRFSYSPVKKYFSKQLKLF